MTSLHLVSRREVPGEAPESLCLRPADFGAAEAFDDEPFSMNVTVEEAAAASASEARVDCGQWAWAS